VLLVAQYASGFQQKGWFSASNVTFFAFVNDSVAHFPSYIVLLFALLVVIMQ
jgi:hypothetical protein